MMGLKEERGKGMKEVKVIKIGIEDDFKGKGRSRKRRKG
jgi:hypothetical protein